MMLKTMTALAGLDDLELVNRSRAGDRDAFGELVARYQSLVCSLAYSATGSLSQSEDVAQETFLAAWRQLGSLREPASLRSWLCGIARNLSNNANRKRAREPVHQSATLDAVANRPTNEPQPGEQAVTREEEELLWRAVERIPENYREPLVLFYRERQSVESVARTLDLTEEAARQRLSRGRKLLESELASFVESTLARTAPGRAFTLGVLASLPAFSLSASAATVGAAAAKGSATATSAGILAVLGAIVGPVIGIAGAYFGFKASLNTTRTPRERQFMVSQVKRVLVATVLFNLGIFGLLFFGIGNIRSHPILIPVLGVALVIGFTGYILYSAVRSNAQFQKLRFAEQKAHPEAYSPAEVTGLVHEYRSKATFLGLPLIHCRSGRVLGEPHRAAVGWIALGDKAYGVLFAGGGVAVGGIALGGAAVGLISVGGICFGAIGLGGLAIGGVVAGGGAIGIIASGGLAIGYTAAMGGLAIAREFAIGGHAIAAHANNPAAQQFFEHFRWIDFRQTPNRNLLKLLCGLPLLLLLFPRFRKRASTPKEALRDSSR